MNDDLEIYRSEKFSIIKKIKANDAIVSLLKETVWGTRSLLYQHKNTEDRISQILQPEFFILYREKEAVATCNLSLRDSITSGLNINNYYIRYFSVSKTRQNNIYAYLLLKHIKKYYEANIDTPSVFFAYVDESNTRSVKIISSFGFQKFRSIETVVFSRLFPRPNSLVIKATTSEKSDIVSLLKQQYKNYSFVNLDRLQVEDNYYVLKIDSEIVAGVQTLPVDWAIRELPGFTGKMIQYVLPYVPILSRLVDPAEYNFVAIDAIYCKQGSEDKLIKLLEAVCWLHNVNSAMFWMDTECELLNRIKTHGRLGLLQMLKDDMPVSIVAGCKNVQEEEIRLFKERPVYVSAFDIG